MNCIRILNTNLEKSALARAKRIRHPPEKCLVAFFCISGLKPKPSSMTLARAGALSASMALSCIYISLSSEDNSALDVELKNNTQN